MIAPSITDAGTILYPASVNSPIAVFTCQHILLVEDDEDDQSFFLEAILRIDPTVTISVAPNGRAALDWLQSAESLPHLLFLDINMPLVNGLECLAAIRKDERFRQLPVFMLSTSGDPVSVAVAKRLGADGYLTKPYLREGLLHRLERVLRLDLSVPKAEREPPFFQLLACNA